MSFRVLKTGKHRHINKKGVRNLMRFVLLFTVLFIVFSSVTEPVI